MSTSNALASPREQSFFSSQISDEPLVLMLPHNPGVPTCRLLERAISDAIHQQRGAPGAFTLELLHPSGATHKASIRSITGKPLNIEWELSNRDVDTEGCGPINLDESPRREIRDGNGTAQLRIPSIITKLFPRRKRVQNQSLSLTSQPPPSETSEHELPLFPCTNHVSECGIESPPAYMGYPMHIHHHYRKTSDEEPVLHFITFTFFPCSNQPSVLEFRCAGEDRHGLSFNIF
jgi:hypothetical protein